MVGVKSVIAEAEYIAMAIEVFEKLGLDAYVSYNNRKLLSGIIMSANVDETNVNDVILSLDKIEKVGEDGVRQELIEKGIDNDTIERLLCILKAAGDNPLVYFKNNCSNPMMGEGVKELEELALYLDAMGIQEKTKLNTFLPGAWIYIQEQYLRYSFVTAT